MLQKPALNLSAFPLTNSEGAGNNHTAALVCLLTLAFEPTLLARKGHLQFVSYASAATAATAFSSSSSLAIEEFLWVCCESEEQGLPLSCLPLFHSVGKLQPQRVLQCSILQKEKDAKLRAEQELPCYPASVPSATSTPLGS